MNCSILKNYFLNCMSPVVQRCYTSSKSYRQVMFQGCCLKSSSVLCKVLFTICGLYVGVMESHLKVVIFRLWLCLRNGLYYIENGVLNCSANAVKTFNYYICIYFHYKQNCQMFQVISVKNASFCYMHSLLLLSFQTSWDFCSTRPNNNALPKNFRSTLV